MNLQVMSGVVDGTYQSIKATLKGFKRLKVKGKIYPGITHN